ncbi:hypothetical protein B7Z28_01410, partial [Candidatus Saccharibacteria bacterium 32-45-3]
MNEHLRPDSPRTPEQRNLKSDLNYLRHRWGKVALKGVGFIAATSVAAGAGAFAGEQFSSIKTVNAEYDTHTVIDGDTLYKIASELYPD